MVDLGDADHYKAEGIEEMIRTIHAGDLIGFQTFRGAIRYGEVVGVLARGGDNRPTRKDEVSIRLKPDGQVVTVQRWRVVERYDAGKVRGRRTP